ncbi:hypothetical protein JL722_11626 [Aureococcus anophagefferens]|nr:hypothetical protein JL722_11626 [Aureococcus anophagefferens]
MAPGDGLETHSVESSRPWRSGVSLAAASKTDIIAALRAAAPVDAVAVPVDDASTGAWNVPGAASASTVPAAPSLPHRAAREPGFRGAPRAPPLAVGARVAYDRDGAARLGVVVAVHNEDPSGPYYTVRLDGPVPRDVQTERGRLRLVATPPRIAGSASLPGRAAQPEAGIDAALGSAFNSQGRGNVG